MYTNCRWHATACEEVTRERKLTITDKRALRSNDRNTPYHHSIQAPTQLARFPDHIMMIILILIILILLLIRILSFILFVNVNLMVHSMGLDHCRRHSFIYSSRAFTGNTSRALQTSEGLLHVCMFASSCSTSRLTSRRTSWCIQRRCIARGLTIAEHLAWPAHSERAFGKLKANDL